MASLAAVQTFSGEQLKQIQPGSALKAAPVHRPPPLHTDGSPPAPSPRRPTQLRAADGSNASPQHAPPQPRPAGNGDQDIDFSDPTLLFDYVLYYHANSPPAMELYGALQDTPIKQKIWFQDLGQLSRDEIAASASWLKGVPILVHKRTGEGYKGKRTIVDVLNKMPAQTLPQPGNTAASSVPPSYGITYQRRTG